MNKFTRALLLCCLFFNQLSLAQSLSLTGMVVDKNDGAVLPGVSVTVVSKSDTTMKTGGVTNAEGNFSVLVSTSGFYEVRLSYLGYKSGTRVAEVTDKEFPMGTIKMESIAKQLKEVKVAGKQIRAEQKEDTSQFNADAYKTNPNASAEDLVKKMPGVTSDGTGVKVNGEQVQQVLVDGKPFFGTDPTLALKNLPAEVIDKIQVFDKLSDQSMFSGFDDGNAQKTLNIITRRGKSEGVFGKLYAGYGTDERYTAGGNMNFFNGDRRITLLGMSNNINQQNFSSEDVLGLSSGGGGRGGRGRGGFGGGANNFMVGQSGGISATNSVGLNYSDTWGKKLKVSGSYFFNNADNANHSGITRNYFTSPGAATNTIYRDTGNSEAINSNHRFNLRMEYSIDSSNSITFTPSLSLQANNTMSHDSAKTTAADVMQSYTDNDTRANNTGYNASANLLYQHKFGKPRRTISLNLNGGLNEKTGDGSYYSLNDYYKASGVTTQIRDQHYDLYNNGANVGANLTYTEPVGKKGQFQISYNPTYSESRADKETKNKNTNGDYVDLDPQFSSKYINTYNTQKGGVSYRIGERNMKFHFNAGVDVQQAVLDGRQEYPTAANINKSFTNVLPNAMLNYRYEDGRNLRVMYRTSTNAPSITQLQNVIDVSNPLLIKTGNADLRQSYDQRFIVRYGLTKAKSGRNFFLNLFVNQTRDYIGTAVYLPTKDSLFKDNVSDVSILVNRGAQLSRPVNLDGYWNGRFFATYGLPVGSIKSNLNVFGGVNASRTPGLINDRLNYADNYIPTFGIVLGSNISEQVDFTVSYTGNYNVVRNTIQSQSNNNFYNQSITARLNWMFLENFVFNTDITHNYYTAFSSTGNQDYFLWNAYMGYKMFKKRLEARVSVYDLLNQNTSITRTVTETYIENANTQVLRQYFMFQLIYTVRKFKSGAAPEAEKRDVPMMPSPPGGFHRPDGRGGW
ncbi:MAG: outer membrane beta-barrel protein [Taibaiella sp.]|nr:outer membrane beta-barrel protein [Taibaiella sp.]